MTENSATGSGTSPGVTLLTAVETIVGGSAGATQEDEQVLVPFTAYNAVAVVPGAQAQEVIAALERVGVDGDRISFLRMDASSRSPALDATPRPELDVGPHGRRVELSVLARAIVGAVAGALVFGLIAVAITDDTQIALGAVLGGAALCGGLGALWAIFRRLGASDAWERALHMDPGDRAVIGVHLDDPAGDRRVSGILEPFGRWVFGRDGSVIRRPSPQSV